MSSTLPEVTCGHCGGHGKIDLPYQLLDTLVAIRKAKRPVTTDDLIVGEFEVGRTAINNRLTKLEEYGLIRRQGKQGKSILWVTTEKGKRPPV